MLFDVILDMTFMCFIFYFTNFPHLLFLHAKRQIEEKLTNVKNYKNIYVKKNYVGHTNTNAL